jgi:hypothetical protein
MMKLTLSDVAHHQLETTFKTTSDPRLHHRCQAILMAARGRRHSHIAEDLAVSAYSGDSCHPIRYKAAI